MIDILIIEILIQGGKIAHVDEANSLSIMDVIKHNSYINRLHWTDWDKVTKLLDIENLIALVRGLTIAEKHYDDWLSGSVSAVIWTFREVQRRDYTSSIELADWILSNSKNPYVPFGTQNHGAKSYKRYCEANAFHQSKIDNGIIDQINSESRANNEKKFIINQKIKSKQDRNTVKRSKFLEKLNNMPIADQIKCLAFDPNYSVEFFPTNIPYKVNQDFINNLDIKLKMGLLIKLKGRRRGPWKKFKKMLLSSYKKDEWDKSTPWDRKKWF